MPLVNLLDPFPGVVQAVDISERLVIIRARKILLNRRGLNGLLDLVDGPRWTQRPRHVGNKDTSE